jgi:hypothetical protein
MVPPVFVTGAGAGAGAGAEVLVDGAGAGAGAVVVFEGAGAGAGLVEPEFDPPLLPALFVLVEPPALDEPPLLLPVLPEPLEFGAVLGAAEDPVEPELLPWFEPPVVPGVAPLLVAPEGVPVVWLAPEVALPEPVVVPPAARPAALKPPASALLAEAPIE